MEMSLTIQKCCHHLLSFMSFQTRITISVVQCCFGPYWYSLYRQKLLKYCYFSLNQRSTS